MSTFLQRLHRDERGLISPLILFLAIGLAYMIVWILNTGQLVADKQRTQNTADAAALVQAEWGARYLNVMAMNNIGSAQATVVAATSVAYGVTLAELAVRSGVIAAKLVEYSATDGFGPAPLFAPYCPTWGKIPLIGGFIQAACTGFQVFRGIGAARAAAYVLSAMEDYRPIPTPIHPDSVAGKATDIIAAMDAMNDYLVKSFPERVATEGLHLVKANDADHLVYHPPCKKAGGCRSSQEGQGGDLPVDNGALEKAVAYQEFCDAMQAGSRGVAIGPVSVAVRTGFSDRGYAMNKGPQSAGGIDNRPIRDFVNDIGETDTELPFFYIWYEAFGPAYYTKVPFSAILEQFAPKKKVSIFGFEVDITDVFIDVATFAMEDLLGIDLGVINPFQLPIDVPPRYEDEQTAKENDFTRKFDTFWTAVCRGGSLPFVGKILADPYWLKGRPVYAIDPFTANMMSDRLTDYRTLAIVSRQPRARLQTQLFKDKTASAYAVAESWIHNPTAFDLYTQDWLAMLVPASHMNRATAVSATIKRSPAARSFQNLTAALDRGGDDAWKAVNTH